MNRRRFLGALTVATAALSLPAFAQAKPEADGLIDWRKYGAVDDAPIPTVYGDGIHDDAAGIQWHMDHGLPLPSHRTYRVSRTLHAHFVSMRENVVIISNSTIVADRGVSPILTVHAAPRAPSRRFRISS